MIAHIDCETRREQSLLEHSRNVSGLCSQAASVLRLGALASLIGLIHDMGKATENYRTYLLISAGVIQGRASRGSVHHAPVGAIFAYRRWFHRPEADTAMKTTAQIVMLTVYGHHSGLMDVITPDGELQLLERLEQDPDVLCYEEAVNHFVREVCSLNELDALFDKALGEIRAFLEKLKGSGITDKPSIRGLLTKELFGILIDADRWDSACFSYGTAPQQKDIAPDWAKALNHLNLHLSQLDHGSPISRIRSRISEECEQAAGGNGHLFRLSVPTGGGKTFASLRFALKRAALRPEECKRIFYVIPFNTILDQNARDIRNALGDSLRILEHHSNVVFEGEQAAEEFGNYRLLTERWDSDLILTSMVQFLNCFYTADNSDARRIPQLSGSIIVFDEIQSLPKKCTRLFEQAIDFLTEFCGCTVVLCTATQPALQFHISPAEIVSDVPTLFGQLKRTRLTDETQTALSWDEASEKAAGLMKRYGAVLMIVNTQKAAQEMAALMKERGYPVAHLSTDMVPAHRIRVIGSIRNWDGDRPLFCVSTALIEAGINISFPCVVRSLAGLGSILQAAGRCNRNGELGEGVLGDVYIWLLRDERLVNLREIADAQQVTCGILASDFILDSPEGIDRYFQNERETFDRLIDYPIISPKATLTDLFGKNTVSRKEIPAAKDAVSFPIPGAFHTVGENFQVIDEQTQSVLVPYEKGEEIIAKLCSIRDMREMTRLLREAQQYSVSLYDSRFKRFLSSGIIRYDENSGVYILRKEYYSQDTGVTDMPVAADYLEV